MSSDLANRVRFAREAFDVERCHTHPHALRYSVGHHSAGVAALVIQTWKEDTGGLPRAELITAALYHDTPELVTGDIPSPAKILLGTRALGVVESRVLEWQGTAPILTDREQEWLEAADSVELFLWCLEEAGLRANQTFASWVDHYSEKWQKTPLPDPFQTIVGMALISVAQRLPWSTLKEIAGL